MVFRKKFYTEKDLYLHESEYTVKVSTAFSLTEDPMKNGSSLSKEYKIVVKLTIHKKRNVTASFYIHFEFKLLTKTDL